MSLQDACVNNPCKNNPTCQTGFIERRYRCSFDAGFEGKDFEIGELNGTNSCGGGVALVTPPYSSGHTLNLL